MEDFKWIQIGKMCRWFDEETNNEIYRIVGIRYEDENEKIIYDDTIIEIDNGYSYAEVLPTELEEISKYPIVTLKNMHKDYQEKVFAYSHFFADMTILLHNLISSLPNEQKLQENEIIRISWNDKFTGDYTTDEIESFGIDTYNDMYAKTKQYGIVHLNNLDVDQKLVLIDFLFGKLNIN